MCSGVSGDGPLHAVRRCGSVRQRDHRVGLEHSYMGSRVHAGPVRRHLRHVVGGEPRRRHVSRSVKPTVRLRSGRWRRGGSWCRSLVSQLWSTRSRSTRREARSSLPPMMAFHACGVHKVLSKSTSARVRRRYGASDWERNEVVATVRTASAIVAETFALPDGTPTGRFTVEHSPLDGAWATADGKLVAGARSCPDGRSHDLERCDAERHPPYPRCRRDDGRLERR